MIEISELDLNDSNFSFEKKSTNFGGGLELLMNDKIKDNNKPTSDIDLDDLKDLMGLKDLEELEDLEYLKDLKIKYKGLEDKYEKCIKVFEKNNTNIGKYNPDDMIANFLCYLGYNGWVRQSSFKKGYYGVESAVDEIYICNINKKFIKERLIETPSCKLSEDKLDKDGLFVDLYGNLVDSHGNLV